MTQYTHGNDSCLSIWADCYESGLIQFPPNARVLEIGCAEADWMTPMLALRPDLDIVGIDWRGCKRPGQVIKGDVLVQEFPEASFDCIVGISSLEHIGLGHYEADPKDQLGDILVMNRILRWLKPGGWVYFDVPWNPAGFQVAGTSHRTYDADSLKRRMLPDGLVEMVRWYADHAGRVRETLPPKALPAFDYVAVLAVKA